MLLQVSPMKGVMRFGKRSKLSPRYIGPFEITVKVGSLAYRLDLPNELSRVHNVFHISQLKKYHHDDQRILQPEILELEEDLSYEEKPVRILDTKERRTRNKVVKLVKVLWTKHEQESATWEVESDMRKRYPEVFKENNCGDTTVEQGGESMVTPEDDE